MSKPERILIFIDHFLPGYKAGGPVRSCANMIEHLKDRYEFFVFTRDREYLEEEPFSGVESDDWNDRDGYQVFYSSEEKLSRKRIRQLIDELAPDTVYINGIYSFRLSILPLWIIKRMGSPFRTVLAPRGMLAPGAMSIKPLKKRFFLFLAWVMSLFKGVIFHATTQQEKSEIQRWIGKREVITVPNLPPAIEGTMDPGITKQEGELRLISIARIAPEKNTLGLLQLLAEQEERGVHLSLYGPVYDPAYWNKCQRVIEQMPEGVTVEHFDGIHPERAPAAVHQHHAFILLTKGENHGHAILEALLAGRPAIISDRTPWKDLEEKKVGYVGSLEETEHFARAIRELKQMEQGSFEALLNKVREYAEEVKANTDRSEAYQQLLEE